MYRRDFTVNKNYWLLLVLALPLTNSLVSMDSQDSMKGSSEYYEVEEESWQEDSVQNIDDCASCHCCWDRLHKDDAVVRLSCVHGVICVQCRDQDRDYFCYECKDWISVGNSKHLPLKEALFINEENKEEILKHIRDKVEKRIWGAGTTKQLRITRRRKIKKGSVNPLLKSRTLFFNFILNFERLKNERMIIDKFVEDFDAARVVEVLFLFLLYRALMKSVVSQSDLQDMIKFQGVKLGDFAISHLKSGIQRKFGSMGASQIVSISDQLCNEVVPLLKETTPFRNDFLKELREKLSDRIVQ